MVDVYKNELYGNLLPDIFIDKITLENSGFIASEENPHIDNEREEIEVSQQDESIKITLNLTIKEEYDNDTVGKWLSEIDFQKYMKIKIYEIRDERLSSLMNLSKDFAVPLDLNTFSNSKGAVLRTLYGYLKVQRERAIDIIKRNVKIHNIEVLQENSGQADNNKQTTVETLDDGTKVLNTHFKKTIQNPRSKIKHLSFYCVSSLDYVSLIKDFKMEPTRNLINFLINMNKISGEVLFDNYQLLNEAYVFVGQDSKVWTGDVHKNAEGQYMSGLRETEDSILLQRKTIQNSTVQDFRRRQRLEKVNFNFNPVKKYFENFKPVNLSSNNNFLSKTNSFFGDIDISLDEDKDAKIKFSIALKNLLFDTSKYSYLIKNHDSLLADSLARLAKIRSIKIMRERVKISNLNDTSITIGKKYTKFSKNEIRQTLIHCKDPAESIDTDKFFLRKIPTALYPDLLEYTGVDKTASEISDGLYRYSIQIEIEDPFQQFLEEKIDTLNLIKNNFEIYLIEAEKQTLSKYFSEVHNPHISHPDEKDIMGSITEGNYNILTNSFTESFINKMNEKYEITTTAPWILFTSVYTDILSIFVEEVDRDTLQSELQKFTSPSTGSPEGIRMTIKLIQQLIFEIERVLGRKNNIDNLSGKTAASKSNKSFVIEHYFNNSVFDANLESEVFVDYLDKKEEKTQKKGLVSFTTEDFKQRMDKEVEKYFVSKNVNVINSINDGQINKVDTRANLFSFLSPSKLIFKKEKISLAPTTVKNKRTRINNAISLAKTPSARTRKNIISQEDADLTIFNTELQTNYNVTISTFEVKTPTEEPKREPTVEVIKEPEEDKNKKINIVSSRQILDFNKIPKNKKRGIKEFISVLGPMANKKTRPFKIEENKKKIATVFTEETRKRLPVQITSVLAGESKDSKKNIIPPKILSDSTYTDNQVIANIGSLKEIQILTGYEKNKENKIMINKPKWEKMTEEKISAIPSNIEVTCRLVDFKDKELIAEDITKSGKTVNTSFTIIGSSDTPAPIEKKETYNTLIQNKNIEVSKELINKAVKNESDKNKFPPKVTKTAIVSSQPIEEIVTRSDVKKETEKKQKQVTSSKQTLPKTDINKQKPEKKKKSKTKIKAKGRR